MTYDPFTRGDFPVGVQTIELGDAARNRQLRVELWYPAEDRYAGRDLAAETRDSYSLSPGFPKAWQRAVREAEPRDGSFPLILFSHGFSGHRRQSTFYTTHLASHGYLVAGVDHAGNTIVDMMSAVGSGHRNLFAETMADRPRDIRVVLDQLLVGDDPVTATIDHQRIGMTGHSFGGWTALAVAAQETRIGAQVLLAPAGAAAKLRQGLDLGWTRPLATSLIAAERDSILALAGITELYHAIPSPKSMVVITGADHMHFCDGARKVHEMVRRLPMVDTLLRPHQPWPPFEELCPAGNGQLVTNGLATAHFDAFLRASVAATELLAGDPVALLSQRGVEITVV